jgi:hypothetical protein
MIIRILGSMAGIDGANMAAPEIRPASSLDSDYGEYFLFLVQRWIDRLQASGHVFKTKKITVSAGPWRFYDVSWEVNQDGSLDLDFYSVARRHGISYPNELTAVL